MAEQIFEKLADLNVKDGNPLLGIRVDSILHENINFQGFIATFRRFAKTITSFSSFSFVDFRESSHGRKGFCCSKFN